MSTNLRVFTAVMGIALCALSILLNWQLYTSLVGSSNLEKASYQFIGIALDVSKILCLLLAVYLWTTADKIILGTLCFIAYIVLSCISLSAGFGFSLKATQSGENERLLSSFAYQNAQNQIAIADSKIAENSHYASIDVNSIQSKASAIERDIAGLETTLSNCPANYITHCIKPTRAKIEAKQRELEPLQVQLSGYNAYHGVMQNKADLMASLGNMSGDSVHTQVIHPLFIAIGELFSVTPNKAKQILLLVSFVALELLGSLFFAIGLSLGNNAYAMPTYESQYANLSNNQNRMMNDLSSEILLLKSQISASKQSHLESPDQVTLDKGEAGHFDSAELGTGDNLKLGHAGQDSDKEVSPDQRTLLKAKPRADNDVSGVNSKRFNAIKKAIQNGKIKPTIASIKAFEYGGVKCNENVAKKFATELEKQGIIERYTLNNGKQSYRLVTSDKAEV